MEPCYWQLETAAAPALLSKQMLSDWDVMVCVGDAPSLSGREGGQQQPCRKAGSVFTTFPHL